jgi:hypothetical protein
MEIASLARRLGALGIDAVLGLLATAGVVAAFVAWARPWKREAPDQERIRRLVSHPLMRGLGIARIVAWRNMRSPGQRLLGIRRADARDGGAVSPSRAAVREWSASFMRAVLKEFVGPRQQRREEQMQALRPQMRAIQQQYQDDKEAQQEALMDFYKEHNVNPLDSCWPVLFSMLAPELPALVTRRHQTLADLISGTVVIRDTSR